MVQWPVLSPSWMSLNHWKGSPQNPAMIFRKGGLIVFENFLNWHEHLLCSPRNPCWTLQELSRRWFFPIPCWGDISDTSLVALWGDGDNAALPVLMSTPLSLVTPGVVACTSQCGGCDESSFQWAFDMAAPLPGTVAEGVHAQEMHAFKGMTFRPWARESIAQGSATPQKALRSHGALL